MSSARVTARLICCCDRWRDGLDNQPLGTLPGRSGRRTPRTGPARGAAVAQPPHLPCMPHTRSPASPPVQVQVGLVSNATHKELKPQLLSCQKRTPKARPAIWSRVHGGVSVKAARSANRLLRRCAPASLKPRSYGHAGKQGAVELSAGRPVAGPDLCCEAAVACRRLEGLGLA